MSDKFYLEVLDEVIELINEFGTDYQVKTPGAFNPATLENENESVRTVKGVVTDSMLGSARKSSDSKITAMEENGRDKVLLLLPSAAPLANESVEVDGRWFSMTGISMLKPANIILLYTLNITR